MRSRSLDMRISLLTLSSIAACDGSVGRDICTGIQTRCTLRQTMQDAGFHFPASGIAASTVDLAVLTPTFAKPLTFPTPRYETETTQQRGLLSGNGRAGLFYARPRADADAVEVYRLDGSGSIRAEGLVLAPLPQDAPSVAEWDIRRFHWAGMHIIQSQGEAPILGIYWDGECDRDVPCSVGEELVALQADLDERPLRMFPAVNMEAHAARTADGGLWVLAPNSLRKYDRDGNVIIRQSLLAHSLPDSTAPGLSPYTTSLVSVTPDQDVYVWSYDEDDARPELWRFDEWGSPRWRVSHYAGDVALITDRRNRLTTFTTALNGDLQAERMDTDDSVTLYTVWREGYSAMRVLGTTEDGGGNLYVLTESGPRSGPIPTICKLPLEGELTCFLAPALTGWEIVGGEEPDVLYACNGANDRFTEWPDHVSEDAGAGEAADDDAGEVTLLRFEIP